VSGEARTVPEANPQCVHALSISINPLQVLHSPQPYGPRSRTWHGMHTQSQAPGLTVATWARRGFVRKAERLHVGPHVDGKVRTVHPHVQPGVRSMRTSQHAGCSPLRICCAELSACWQVGEAVREQRPVKDRRG
jgi:hypothetical protein